MDNVIFKGESGAVLSYDKKYRYALWRRWDPTLKTIMFIMLNPSTADETKNDPTIHKCMEYAKRWGYGTLLVGNVYAYRSSDPRVLSTIQNPIGELCDSYIYEMAKHSDMIIAAWGNNIISDNRVNAIRAITGKLYCLEKSKSRHPKHPLYLRKTLKPISF